MEEKLEKILTEYRECDTNKPLCSECSAYEKIPFTETPWCVFLRSHGVYAINAVIDYMGKVL